MSKNTYINCLVVSELKKHLYILTRSNSKVKFDIEAKYLDFSLGVGDVIVYGNDRYILTRLKKKNLE